jgi:hypothetical protein
MAMSKKEWPQSQPLFGSVWARRKKKWINKQNGGLVRRYTNLLQSSKENNLKVETQQRKSLLLKWNHVYMSDIEKNRDLKLSA